jgi:hypothetical protein
MAESVSEISRLEAEEKVIEKQAKNKVHDEKALAAVAKLKEKGRAVTKLTVKEIEAILFKVYNITLGGSNLRKPDYVKALEREMASASGTGKYEDFLWLLAADNAAMIPPALATIEDVGTAEGEEEVEELVSTASDDVEVEGGANLDDADVDSEDGGEWEADDADVDDRVGGNEYDYDTDLINVNVMDKDESELEGDELVRIRSTRQKLMPVCYKECFF